MCCYLIAAALVLFTGPEDSEHVIRVLDLRPGLVVADIGCGTGWLSAEVAKALSPGGRVYAVEIQKAKVEQVRRRGVANIVAVHSKPDDVSLAENSIDVAFLHDVASHVKRRVRPAFYASIALALRPHGRLVIFGPHGKAESMLEELRRYRFIPEREAELAKMSRRELNRQLKQGIRFRYRKIQVF